MNCRRVLRPALVILGLSALAQACSEPTSSETIRVSLKNTDTYRYPTVGGDEDGARIVSQALHYRVSEIRRDATSNWVATYVYEPTSAFVGSDHVLVEIRTGSNGASPPTSVRRVTIDIDVHD